MEFTKLINDVLSTFTSYIVDNAADPYYLDGVKEVLGTYVKSFDYISMAAYSSSDVSKEIMNYIIGGNS